MNTDQAADEDSLRYEGWRVTTASGAGVFFATLFFYTFAVFLKPVTKEGVTGAALIGFGAGGESAIAPYLLSRYFGLRSVSTLYGVTWMAVACGAAAVPVVMARSIDQTGSYEPVLFRLAVAILASPRLRSCSPPTRSRLTPDLSETSTIIHEPLAPR